jgi:hypothetical protein
MTTYQPAGGQVVQQQQGYAAPNQGYAPPNNQGKQAYNNPGVPQYGNQNQQYAKQGYGNQGNANQAYARKAQPMTVNSQVPRSTRQTSFSEKIGLTAPKVETMKMAEFENQVQFANKVFGAPFITHRSCYLSLTRLLATGHYHQPEAQDHGTHSDDIKR